METDQTEQLDTLLDQSAWALNKNQETGETDMSTSSKCDNRSPCPLDNRDV